MKTTNTSNPLCRDSSGSVDITYVNPLNYILKVWELSNGLCTAIYPSTWWCQHIAGFVFLRNKLHSSTVVLSWQIKDKREKGVHTSIHFVIWVSLPFTEVISLGKLVEDVSYHLPSNLQILQSTVPWAASSTTKRARDGIECFMGLCVWTWVSVSLHMCVWVDIEARGRCLPQLFSTICLFVFWESDFPEPRAHHFV